MTLHALLSFDFGENRFALKIISTKYEISFPNLEWTLKLFKVQENYLDSSFPKHENLIPKLLSFLVKTQITMVELLMWQV